MTVKIIKLYVGSLKSGDFPGCVIDRKYDDISYADIIIKGVRAMDSGEYWREFYYKNGEVEDSITIECGDYVKVIITEDNNEKE